MQSVSWSVFMVFTNTAMPVCDPEIKSEIEDLGVDYSLLQHGHSSLFLGPTWLGWDL